MEEMTPASYAEELNCDIVVAAQILTGECLRFADGLGWTEVTVTINSPWSRPWIHGIDPVDGKRHSLDM